MFREYVCCLAVGHAVEEVEQLLLTVAVQERQVDTMLALEMPHGSVLATADDLASGLIVPTKLHRK